MTPLAIRATGVSKKYVIQKTQQPTMLREQITDLVRSGARTISQLGNGKQRSPRDNHIWALKDVSFEVSHGESIGIIGANGAGKTTLLRILSRITAPTEGKIRLCGRVGSLLEVGTGFHSELTGRENVYLNGAILGMRKSEIDRKFAEIVDFSGVEDFIDTPVKRYSTGMRMRLAFSVAAHLEPEVLLVDEVLAVGDLEFQKKSLNKMESVVREGRTVLFVSHNLAAVKAFCPTSIYLENGTMKFFGDTDTAIQSYSDRDAAVQEMAELNIDESLDAQILSITPSGTDGEARSAFPHDEPVFVRVKMHQSSTRYKTHLALKLYNHKFETILTTRDFESRREFLTPTSPGVYVFQIRIPENLLTPGQYYLGAEIAGMTKKARLRTIHRLDHASGFEIFDNASLLSQLNVPWQGVIHPEVDWEILSTEESI